MTQDGVRALDLVSRFDDSRQRAVLAVELEDHGLAGEKATCRSMPSRAMAASSSPPPANATPAERPSAPSAAASCAPRPPSTPAAAGAAAVAPTAHAPPAHAVPAAESIVAPAAVAAVAPAATAAASGPSSVGARRPPALLRPAMRSEWQQSAGGWYGLNAAAVPSTTSDLTHAGHG